MKVEIKNLSKSYFLSGKEIPVLRDISIDINSGEAMSLTGSSGVGKSTFLHLVGTLDTPSEGTLIYNGQNLASFSDAKIAHFRNQNIGFVFQFHHLLSEFSALENVMMPLMMRRLAKNLATKKAMDVLSFVGLKNRAEHKPGELSGGEQQRVALARALVQEPTLLLADEPTGNLDEKTGNEIVDLILQYNKNFKISVILATHNPKISESFGKKLILEKSGMTVITAGS